MKKAITAGVAAGAALLVLAGCSSTGNAGTPTSASTIGGVDGTGKTLTVWTMSGDLSDATLKAINDEFTKETGAQVDLETQQWDGIVSKVTTALATSTPPDVVDLGNTQVPSFAASGGLLDLTQYQSELAQGQTWIGGLADPATVDGKLYAVPSFAGDRAVIYNKTAWAAAGITAAPTTYQELTADLDKLKAANTASDYSAFYLPGKYWYDAVQWVWDAGGDIATQGSDGKWTAGFADAKAQKGLNDFKTFQNAYSIPSSQTLNSTAPDPDQDQVFSDGKTDAILANSWEIGVIEKNNPAITDADLGSFPFPGTSGQAQPVMLGGSDWGIAAKSQNQQLALVWAKIAASPDIQSKYVYGTDGWIPNSKEGIAAAQSTLKPLQSGFFTAALSSKSTPASADWATIEGDNSITDFFAAVASGSKSTSDAAADFDSHIESTLNQ